MGAHSKVIKADKRDKKQNHPLNERKRARDTDVLGS